MAKWWGCLPVNQGTMSLSSYYWVSLYDTSTVLFRRWRGSLKHLNKFWPFVRIKRTEIFKKVIFEHSNCSVTMQSKLYLSCLPFNDGFHFNTPLFFLSQLVIWWYFIISRPVSSTQLTPWACWFVNKCTRRTCPSLLKKANTQKLVNDCNILQKYFSIKKIITVL